MSLRDPKRSQAAFGLDPKVSKLLRLWAKSGVSPSFSRELLRLEPEVQAQLRARLAELALGQLSVIRFRQASTDTDAGLDSVFLPRMGFEGVIRIVILAIAL